QSAVGSPFDLHLIITDDTSIADVGVFENGQRVGGSFTGGEIRIRLALPDGRHELVIVAVDSVGNRTERAITLVVDTRPPVLTLDPPSSVSTPTFTLTGSAIDAGSGLASLAINGEPVVPFLDGSFSEKLALTKGANDILVQATDKAGNTTSQTFTVTYRSSSTTAPSSLYVVLTIGSTDMEVNGMTRTLDAAPFIKDGRTLLPIRALIETLGGSVEWNASTKTATVMLGSRTVALTIGSTTALVGGKAITLDVAPMIIKGRTFLPLRAVAENLGLDLAWEPISRTISLTYWP
ncbi:MAG: stalk domain-containing protein, partial [Caldiserica bacterium]|nr:stalk domain-containing protein [Caldisericota bacterium]